MKDGNTVAVHWKDKRDVYAMSAIHGLELESVERRNGDLLEKPKIICQYSKYKNGVDKCDQHPNYYSVGRKSIKWWKRILFTQSVCTSSKLTIKTLKQGVKYVHS